MPPFAGSLITKRKSDLVEIATALGLDEIEGNMTEIRERIQAKLDLDASSLRSHEDFKGLYTIRGRRTIASEEDTPGPDAQTPARRRRTKAERLIDAAAIPLPDSPMVQEATDNVLAVVESDGEVIAAHYEKVSDAVVKVAKDAKLAAEIRIRETRNYLSRPEGLIPAALLIEYAFLYVHVVPFRKHIWTFPPPVYETGSFASLLRTLFVWMPRVSWTLVYPKAESVYLSSPLWPAVAWWAIMTVIPPLILSTVISFVPQKGVYRTSATTRYQTNHPPTPTVDDLAYAFIRLAILVYALTSAASANFVEALEISGNTQARAVGAALLAALLVANRFGSR